MKRIACALLAVMVLALTACGGSAVGRYKLDKITDAAGNDYSSFLGMMGLSPSDLFIELKADNTFSMNAIGQSAEGTYELTGSTLKLTFQGETMVGELKNNVITFAEDDSIMSFKK